MVNPPNTFEVATDNQRFDLPDIFKDDLTELLAALEWARVHNRDGFHGATANELRAGSKVALRLANKCQVFAAQAQKLVKVK